jgi:hypothetical protein
VEAARNQYAGAHNLPTQSRQWRWTDLSTTVHIPHPGDDQ